MQQAATPAYDPATTASDSEPGAGGRAIHYFGDYELLREIARGGMGVVYKARQVSLNRVVAIKMLLFGKLAGGDFVKRFRAEAEAAASLQHPHIVAIHEVGEHDGQQYFSMDYVEGMNLAEHAREQPLTARRAAIYLKTIAEAIHYAHLRGILHRDLKPSNIVIDTQDQPRITDFGLAKRLIDFQGPTLEHPLTITGQVLGTPAYMPPEQAGGRRREMTVASDVYSLGAILYHLLTGRPPFGGDTPEAALVQLMQNDPVSPRLFNPAVPRDLEIICLKCLSKEPERRYESSWAFAEDLGRWLNGVPIRARPIIPAERLWRWCQRRPALAVLVLALLLVGGAGLAGIVWQWKRAEQHAVREVAQRIRAERAVTFLELQRAEDLLEKGESIMGVAYLARMVRQQPTNTVSSRRLLSALTQRDFAWPTCPPLLHDRKVTHASFSPDSRRVVTASLDFRARVWDSQTGQPLIPQMVHQNGVRSAIFSPDGTRVLTYADDFRAYLWDAATGSATGPPMPHVETIHSARFSPDGNQIVTASADGTARVWDAHTAQPVSRGILRHDGAVVSAAFSPDGRQLLTASADKTVQLWDSATFQPRGKPFRHGAGLKYAEFSPDGKWVVTLAGDSTCVWDVDKGEPLSRPFTHPDSTYLVQFLPDGQRIATTTKYGFTRVWSAKDWSLLAGPMSGGGHDVRFSPDGERMMTGSDDSTARLWDVSKAAPLLAPMQHGGGVWSGRFSPGGLFAVTTSADKTARVWDLRPGAARSLAMRHNGSVRVAEFSPDEQRIVTGSYDGTGRLWSVTNGQPIGPALVHGGRVIAARFSRDGRRVATGSMDGTVRVWNAHTGEPLTPPLKHRGGVPDVSFNPDGQWLATASYDATVRIWNAETGEPRGEPISHGYPVGFVCFSPDGQRLLSGESKNNTAPIRDAATHQLIVTLRGHTGFITAAEFSSDGERVLTASEDGTACLWNARTGQLLTAPLQHKGFVHSANFDRTGRWVVTASQDTTAQVWDAVTGDPMGEPLRHREEVITAEFSPDGSLVLTASGDGTAQVWDALTGHAVTEPFRDGARLWAAHFSPDGRHVITASDANQARLWDVPPAIDRAASSEHASVAFSSGLLADLAEAVVGTRVNERGTMEFVSSARLGEIHRRASALPSGSDFARWLHWFFADRGSRPISPSAFVGIADYVRALAIETNEVSLREALSFRPTNGVALARLAKCELRRNANPTPADLAMANWHSRQAIKYRPMDMYTWDVRLQVLERNEAWTELLADTDATIQAQPLNVYAWNVKARALDSLGRPEEMLAACIRAIECWDSQPSLHSDIRVRRDILRRRSLAYRSLGRKAEAAVDRMAVFGLAVRNPQTSPQLIDLSLFYNGSELEGFPKSVQHLAGVDFDFRGWVHLNIHPRPPGDTGSPESVNDIPIQQRCRRIHFLHTIGHSSYITQAGDGSRREVLRVPLGAEVGRYIIHYDDGQQVDVPIVHGRDVREYWQYPESTPDDPTLVAAWTGSSREGQKSKAITRFYKSSWENPRPDVPIRSLDFVHGGTLAVPILGAITTEPWNPSRP